MNFTYLNKIHEKWLVCNKIFKFVGLITIKRYLRQYFGKIRNTLISS